MFNHISKAWFKVTCTLVKSSNINTGTSFNTTSFVWRLVDLLVMNLNFFPIHLIKPEFGVNMSDEYVTEHCQDTCPILLPQFQPVLIAKYRLWIITLGYDILYLLYVETPSTKWKKKSTVDTVSNNKISKQPIKNEKNTRLLQRNSILF